VLVPVPETSGYRGVESIDRPIWIPETSPDRRTSGDQSLEAEEIRISTLLTGNVGKVGVS
jgi:hypothetical protein